jgi:hypothetical protein
VRSGRDARGRDEWSAEHGWKSVSPAQRSAPRPRTENTRLLGITRRRLYSRLDSIAHGRLEPPDDDG